MATAKFKPVYEITARPNTMPRSRRYHADELSEYERQTLNGNRALWMLVLVVGIAAVVAVFGLTDFITQ